MNIREALAEFFSEDYDAMKEYRIDPDDLPVQAYDMNGEFYTACKAHKDPNDSWKNWGDGTPEFTWVHEPFPWLEEEKGWKVWKGVY